MKKDTNHSEMSRREFISYLGILAEAMIHGGYSCGPLDEENSRNDISSSSGNVPINSDISDERLDQLVAEVDRRNYNYQLVNENGQPLNPRLEIVDNLVFDQIGGLVDTGQGQYSLWVHHSYNRDDGNPLLRDLETTGRLDDFVAYLNNYITRGIEKTITTLHGPVSSFNLALIKFYGGRESMIAEAMPLTNTIHINIEKMVDRFRRSLGGEDLDVINNTVFRHEILHAQSYPILLYHSITGLEDYHLKTTEFWREFLPLVWGFDAFSESVNGLSSETLTAEFNRFIREGKEKGIGFNPNVQTNFNYHSGIVLANYFAYKLLQSMQTVDRFYKSLTVLLHTFPLSTTSFNRAMEELGVSINFDDLIDETNEQYDMIDDG